MYNGVPYAFIKSLQGDIVAILDENGNTVVSYGYDAWGAPLWCTGELAETLGKVQPFRYRGYVFDEETGLYYLRSRYYNPRWGRFVNADTIITEASGSGAGNLYAYCANAPVIYSDENGNVVALAIWGTIAVEDFLLCLFTGGAVTILGVGYLSWVTQEHEPIAWMFNSGGVSVGSVELPGEDVLPMPGPAPNVLPQATPAPPTAQLTQQEITESLALRYDPDPNRRPGQKKQGRENKGKSRTKDNWKPRNNRRDGSPRPLPKHTPGREHRKYKIEPPKLQ